MPKKTKTVVSIIAVVLAAMMALSLLTTVLYSLADNKSDLSNLKSQLSDVTAQRKEIQSQLDQINDEMDQALEKKEKLEKEINTTGEQIELTRQIIAELDDNIAETTNNLTQAENDEAEQYESFKKRLRAMYENDDLTTLDLIFSCSSMTEFLDRVEAESAIAKSDKKIMARLEDTREYIEDLKAELESDKADQEQQQADLEDYQEQLNDQNVELDKVIIEIKNNKEVTEGQLAEVEAQEDEFNQEIKDLAAKIAKEEAAAKAAQNQSSSSSSGSSSSYTGGTMLWPLPGYYNISSPFAMRVHPITGVYSHHTGIDIPAPKGTPIIAAAGGTVVAAGYNTAYGNRVIINHGGGLQTLYGHMSKIGVSENQSVSAGDTIGYVGATGYATGNHLHFSVIVNGNYVDPTGYVSG